MDVDHTGSEARKPDKSNHTANFWSIVRAKTATMEKAKAWLKEHGQILEEEV
jgi:predicted metal-dependent hydrolase